MFVRSKALWMAIAAPLLVSTSAFATPFSFSTGGPDGRIGLASRPDTGGVLEIEAADDFILGQDTRLTSASFIGLIPLGLPLSAIDSVTVEIYRVFPKDSDTNRTPNVPTRANSPSDVEFDGRDSTSGDLSFNAKLLNSSFTAQNSILNGIHAGQTPATGGEGAITGQEVEFDVDFNKAIDLPADHYFFVPQVHLTNGDFFWLSAAGPISFVGDLQAWIRNGNLDPDWLRAGTDIIGGGANAPRFNESFALAGETVPEPTSLLLLGSGLLGLVRYRRGSKTSK
jgi:hypothetical protein